MKTHNASCRSTCTIWIYAVLIISSACAALFVVHNIKISPDSMRFALISQEILSGNGIRVPIIRLEDMYVPVNGAIPFLDNTPLLPVLFSLLGGVTAHNYLPAQIINVICHSVISVFTFLIMMNLWENRGAALLTGIITAFSYPLLKITHHISSEPLMIAFMTAAIYFLTLSRKTGPARSGRMLFAAGMCAGAAILARNAAIALIPVFFWEALILMKNKRPEVRKLSAGLGLALPVLTTAGMFLRNYVISGTLRGFTQAPPERSLTEAFTGTVEMIFEQFHLGGNAVVPVIIVVILSVLSILFHAGLRKGIVKFLHAGLDSVVVFIISYTALVCLTMATAQWRFEVRYVSPLVPFLFICAVLLIVFFWGKTRAGEVSAFSLVGMILSLALLTSGSFSKTYVNLPEFTYKQIKHYALLQNRTYQWVKAHYKEDVIITTNKPFHLGFFGGYSTVAIPHKMFNPTVHIPEDMGSILPGQMLKFGSPVLVLFDSVRAEYFGKYMAELFQKRKSNDSFELVYECPDGVVYSLKN